MANHKSAKKRIRTNERRRVRNKASMSSLKTLTKKVYDSKEKANAEVNLKEAISFIDKTVSKGRIHKNTAARRKSALTRFVNKLEADK
ncbi:MAG: 30S ribosomal protein S20 [Ignavibacteriae bacterium]|nr:30S ribosomal protein S20 [Ignavibacteriota bacterium]NOG98813.1 30S ribosomal protein S20 [Ignavibacteriota bacterium]